MSDLGEIDHGRFAGLTNDEIEVRNPGELARRAESKYSCSFPGAASPVLVTHEMIGRMLLRTLLRLDPQDALGRSLPHGSVIEVWPADTRANTHGA